jgi:Fe-S oxidoreductase
VIYRKKFLINEKTILSMFGSKISQIKQHISQCITCGQCNLSCPTHVAGIFNPLGVLRDLQMGNIENAIINQSIYNCLTCNRCMTFCPASKDGVGMNIAKLIRSLRIYAVDHDIKPKILSEEPGCCTIHVEKVSSIDTPEIYSPFDLDHYFPSISNCKIAKKGEIGYFIGDLPFLEQKNDSLDLNFTEIPQAVVKILNAVNINPVVLVMENSGHDALWAGNVALFKSVAAKNIELYHEAGVKTIVVEDAESYRTLKYDYSRIGLKFDFEVLHLSEFLLKNHLMSKLSFINSISAACTFQDSSRLGRLGGKHYQEPRSVLAHIPGLTLHELESNKKSAFDYAGGIHMVNDQDTIDMWLERIAEVQDVKADYFVTTSLKALIQYHTIVENNVKDDELGIIIPMKDWAVFLSRFLK